MTVTASVNARIDVGAATRRLFTSYPFWRDVGIIGLVIGWFMVVAGFEALSSDPATSQNLFIVGFTLQLVAIVGMQLVRNRVDAQKLAESGVPVRADGRIGPDVIARYCSNCQLAQGEGATVCPGCGTFLSPS